MGPTPYSSVTVVPEAATAVVSFFFAWRSWASMRRKSSRNSAASSRRAACTAPAGLMSSSRRPAWAALILFETPPGEQLAQHGVQPAHYLGAGPAQIPVPLGPRLQHRRVIIRLDFAPGR
jgi:hypothetical protein